MTNPIIFDPTVLDDALSTADKIIDTPLVYVDPHPDKKGDDLVWEKCHCGDGIYHAPSRITWDNGRGDTKWCFDCNGAAGRNVKVSSIRARERRHVKMQNEWLAGKEKREAAQKVAEAAQYAADWDAAHREQERRANLVTGFAGEVGDKIVKVPGTITTAVTFEALHYTGRYMENRALVAITLDNGLVLKAMGTGQTLYGHERGDRVIVSGTIKKHDVWNGQDQTVLTRAKVIAE